MVEGFGGKPPFVSWFRVLQFRAALGQHCAKSGFASYRKFGRARNETEAGRLHIIDLLMPSSCSTLKDATVICAMRPAGCWRECLQEVRPRPTPLDTGVKCRYCLHVICSSVCLEGKLDLPVSKAECPEAMGETSDVPTYSSGYQRRGRLEQYDDPKQVDQPQRQNWLSSRGRKFLDGASAHCGPFSQSRAHDSQILRLGTRCCATWPRIKRTELAKSRRCRESRARCRMRGGLAWCLDAHKHHISILDKDEPMMRIFGVKDAKRHACGVSERNIGGCPERRFTLAFSQVERP